MAVSEKSCRNIVSDTLAVFVPLVPVTVKFEGLELVADSPVTVIVVLCPAVMEVGLNEQVTPDEQAKVILDVKLRAAAAEIVKVVERVPISRLLDWRLDESVKSPPPAPDRETD